MIEVAVDIQGADKPLAELVSGVFDALEDAKDLFVYVCGDKGAIEKAIEGKTYDKKRFAVVDAPETVLNTDNPVDAVNTKKNSSLIAAIELCKQGSAKAAVTCGATGAVFVAAMLMLKKIADCPALLCEPRKIDGTPFCIVDCGANVDCRAEKLVQFAKLGCAYMKTIGTEQPKVALLNNGAEDKKGSALTKKANELLRAAGIDFIGNLEGTDILTGAGDVVVCEGFSGNILLKTMEGVALGVLKEIDTAMAKLGITDSGYKALHDKLYKKYNYTELDGAVLLGFSAPIIKGHGAATSETVYHIIRSAYILAKNDIADKIKQELSATDVAKIIDNK